MRGPDERGDAGDEGGRRAGAPALVVAAVGVGDDDVDAGRAERSVPAAGGEGRAAAVAVHGGHGDHARVGGRVRGPVALAAAVAGRGHHDGALAQRVLHRRVLAALRVGGLAVVAEREVDDVGAVVGGPADAVGEGRAAGALAGRVALFEDHPHREDPDAGRDADHPVAALRAVAAAGDDAGHRGAVPGPGRVAAPGPEPDHVLAREHLAPQVGVVGVHAGVEHGDRDALALGRPPGVRGVDGVQRPLLGLDAVGLGHGRRRQQREAGQRAEHRERARAGPALGESAELAVGGGAGAGPEGTAPASAKRHLASIAAFRAVRKARSTQAARPFASCPRPASAGSVVAPRAVARSAGSGRRMSRPSAKQLTAYTTHRVHDQREVGQHADAPTDPLGVAEALGRGAVGRVRLGQQVGALVEPLGGEPGSAGSASRPRRRA